MSSARMNALCFCQAPSVKSIEQLPDSGLVWIMTYMFCLIYTCIKEFKQ